VDLQGALSAAFRFTTPLAEFLFTDGKVQSSCFLKPAVEKCGPTCCGVALLALLLVTVHLHLCIAKMLLLVAGTCFSCNLNWRGRHSNIVVTVVYQ